MLAKLFVHNRGLTAQRLLDHLQGFLRPAHQAQGYSQTRIARADIGIESDGPLHLGDGQFILLLLQIDIAQDVWPRRGSH